MFPSNVCVKLRLVSLSSLIVVFIACGLSRTHLITFSVKPNEDRACPATKQRAGTLLVLDGSLKDALSIPVKGPVLYFSVLYSLLAQVEHRHRPSVALS